MIDEKAPAVVLTAEDARAFVHAALSELPNPVHLGPRSNELRIQIAPDRTIIIGVGLGSF